MTAIQELEERYSSGVYAKRGVTIVRGEGTRLWDEQGKEYIDCAAGMGVASLGHAHAMVAEALAQGVGTVILGDARVEQPIQQALQGQGTVIR